ncbi:hypothetical protein FACS189426_20980 [Bacteroidia bacterium]|nr:hypothetical protein FACS189426_20980 [Bacteroidia bacterium]
MRPAKSSFSQPLFIHIYMKQIIQDLKSGQTILEEVPSPQVREGCVLIQTTHSLVSLGTERMLVEFGKAYSKERIEVYSQERTLILDNWITLKGYGFKGFSTMKSRQDKGHKAQFALLNERIKTGGDALIPFDSIINTTKASFACIESLKTKSWVDIL